MDIGFECSVKPGECTVELDKFKTPTKLQNHPASHDMKGNSKDNAKAIPKDL